MTKNVVIILILIGILTGCNSSHITTNSRGLSVIDIDGVKRSFYLKLPEDYDEKQKYSLMLYLHPAGLSAFGASREGFTEIAHKNNIIMVYPSGLLGNWKLYNDTPKGSSDVMFIKTLIDTISKQYSINKKRVFVSGRSLGGFMALKLAFEIPNKLAGISVISGSVFPEHLPKKQLPISIQHIHAIDDNGILFNGTEGQILSIPDSITFWKGVNKTKEEPIIFYNQDGIVASRWEADKTDANIELIVHTKGGHGKLPLTPDFVIDFVNNN